MSNFQVGQPGGPAFIPPPSRRAEEDQKAAFQALIKKEQDKKTEQSDDQKKADRAREATQKQAAGEARRTQDSFATSRFAESLFAKVKGEKAEKPETGKVKGEEETKEGEEVEGGEEAEGEAGEVKGEGKGKGKGEVKGEGKGKGKGEVKGEGKGAGQALAAGAKGMGAAAGPGEQGAREAVMKEGASKEAASHAATKDLKAAKSEKSEKSEKSDKKERTEKGEKQAEASGAKLNPHVHGKGESGKSDSKGGEGGGKPGGLSKEDLQKELAKGMAGQVGQPHPFALQGPTQAAPAQPAQKVQIPTEIVDKIVAQARFGMNAEGAQEFQIDLKHDVFKGLKLKITTKDGKVGIQMIADNAEVQKNFEGKAADLAKALAAKGLNVTDVQVTLAGQQSATDGESKGKQGASAAGAVGGGARRTAPGAAKPGQNWVDGGPKTSKDYTA